jgi:hypothetical protein
MAISHGDNPTVFYVLYIYINKLSRKMLLVKMGGAAIAIATDKVEI